MKASVRTKIENAIEPVIPEDAASDFNQGLIELGAIVCVPNGEAKCEICPLTGICEAKRLGIQNELPVKKKAKARRIEERTVLIFKDGDHVAIRKRPEKGLLAGLYELPNIEEHLNKKEITQYCKEIGLMPIHIKKLPAAKHIFSHIEWQMIGYDIADTAGFPFDRETGTISGAAGFAGKNPPARSCAPVSSGGRKATPSTRLLRRPRLRPSSS